MPSFCRSCRAELKPEYKFCRKCGASVPVDAPVSAQATAASVAGRGGSGIVGASPTAAPATEMLRCGSCQGEVRREEKFCRRCGAPLSAAPVPAIARAQVTQSPTREVPAAAARPEAPARLDSPAGSRPIEERRMAASDGRVREGPQTGAFRVGQPAPVPSGRAVSASPLAGGENERRSETAVRERRPRSSRTLVGVGAAIVILVVGGAGYYLAGNTIRSMFAGGKPPARAEQYVSQGIAYATLKDYDNAIKEFSRAVEAAPGYSAAYANRGVAYMQQKKLNLALDDLKKATELDPKDKIGRYNLAALYAVQGRKDRALESLDAALGLGFDQYDALRSDPDLASIRSDPEFMKVLEKHKVFLR